jgi:hypothetical protein
VIQTRLNVDIGSSNKTRQFVSMGDVIARLPKIDPGNKSTNPLPTFYRGFLAYNITGLIYIHTFMQLNKFGVKELKKEKYEGIGINLKSQLIIQFG